MESWKMIRVWKYRGWCFVCRRCDGSGCDFPSQTLALAAAELHVLGGHR